MPSPPDQRLKLSINPSIINKNDDKASYVSGFENGELMISELADHIDQGHAFCCQLNGKRSKASFLCSGVLAIDFDGHRTMEDALADPFVQEHLSLAYTTPSHTEDLNRFRLVFALPSPIEDPVRMGAALRSLSLQLAGNRAATDPAHLFFGSKGSRPQVFNRALSEDVVEELVKRGVGADTRIKNDGIAMTTVSRQVMHPDAAVVLPDGGPVTFSTLPRNARVCCPFHYDRSASAFVTESKKGTKGLHCMTCGQTFWGPDKLDEVDFLDFDKCIADAEKYFSTNQDRGPFQLAFSDEFHPGLEECRIHRLKGGFLDLGNELPEGLMFVKSPKGTGKTKALESFVKGAEGRVLLIGHRIALIKQSCSRFDLDCYLDRPPGEIHWNRMGVCLDSLTRLVKPSSSGSRKPFIDYLIIDESEQVLAHFLSGTIKDKDRNELFHIFRLMLRSSKRIVALDADLGWLTFETLTKMASAPDKNYKPKKSTIFLNERKVYSAVDIYGSKAQLIGEIKSWAKAGCRVFVPSNSKRQLERLHEGFRRDLPGVRTLLITSDTTGDDAVKRFIKNPTSEAGNYDVIFASPTLGTGVDITFENDESVVEGVFGIFETGVSTHFEIDQQIWRVRHPKSVKVWISPATFFFDTSLDVIQRDIQTKNLFKNTLSHYDDEGRPVYHTGDAMIDMAALARSQQVASKNRLKKNFIDMKSSHGHAIRYVDKDATIHAVGQVFEKRSREWEEEQYAASILKAPKLTKDKFDDLEEKAKKGLLDRADKFSLERYRIERFYHQPVDKALLALDARGAFRKQIFLFEQLRDMALSQYAPPSVGTKEKFVKNDWMAGGLLLSLVAKAGAFEGSQFRPEMEFSSLTLGGFMAHCIELRPQIENLLDIEVGEDPTQAVRLLSKVLRKVGVVIDEARTSRAKGLAGGQKIRFYKLCEARLKQIEQIVATRDSARAVRPTMPVNQASSVDVRWQAA